MITYNAKDYGVTPEKDVTKELVLLIGRMNETKEEKLLNFEPGTYYINSEDCKKCLLYITNSTGDDEFKEDEVPHSNLTPFYFENVENLTVQGNGAVFIIDGRATNMVMLKCRNIVIDNLEIKHAHPDMHEFKVVKKTPFTVDFELDRDTNYYVKDGRLYFYGLNYDYPADEGAKGAFWIGLVREKDSDYVCRTMHPLGKAGECSEVSPGVVRFKYKNTFRFKKGDRFYAYYVRRQYAGIFLDGCDSVTVKRIKQRYNYSLAYVAQNSSNLSVENVEFTPEKDDARLIISCADFLQICMCRGKVSVTDSVFEGSQDDCMNVHGFHFGITEKTDNKIKVSFMHPQSHGYNALRAGDEIAYINPETLLEEGRAKIVNSEMISENDILLTLDSAECAKVGGIIEDISACPEIYFANNTINRVITRGLLLTTRGKVVIENNHFKKIAHNGINIEDDAKYWFESGRCEDITVKNNVFDFCGGIPVLIQPENPKHEGAVHKNIKFINNEFKKYRGVCFSVKSTDNLLLSGNKFSGLKIRTKNCSNVTIQ